MNEPPEDGSTDDDLTFDGADTLVALLAEITDADRQRLEPPPSIWNAIVATVSADRDGRPDRTLTLTDNGDGSVVADVSPIELQATTTIALARRRSTDQPILPSEMSPWGRQWLPVAAAVAVTIVGGLVTWAFSDEFSGDGGGNAAAPLDGEVVAVTEMTDDRLPDGSSTVSDIGEARLVLSGGRYYLDVDVGDLPDVDGYYELWINDPETDGVLSLGVLGGDGRHALPDNLDPADFPVVDVSVESLDGDPTHSGRSVWRGRLDP